MGFDQKLAAPVSCVRHADEIAMLTISWCTVDPMMKANLPRVTEKDVPKYSRFFVQAQKALDPYIVCQALCRSKKLQKSIKFCRMLKDPKGETKKRLFIRVANGNGLTEEKLREKLKCGLEEKLREKLKCGLGDEILEGLTVNGIEYRTTNSKETGEFFKDEPMVNDEVFHNQSNCRCPQEGATRLQRNHEKHKEECAPGWIGVGCEVCEEDVIGRECGKGGYA